MNPTRDHAALAQLRDQAAAVKDAQLVADYRAIWSDLWDNKRVAWGVPCDPMNYEVKPLLLAFLRDGVPAETAKMVATEYMKGLTT